MDRVGEQVPAARSTVSSARAATDRHAPWVDAPSTLGPPEDGGSGPSRILVPYNGSAPARRALDVAAVMSLERPTVVWVLYVRAWDVGRGGRICLETREEAKACADTAVAELRRRGVSTRGVVLDARRERVSLAIVAQAEALQVRCIVLGRHDRSSWATVLLGSTSRSVTRHAPCLVVTLRTPRQRRRGRIPWCSPKRNWGRG